MANAQRTPFTISGAALEEFIGSGAFNFANATISANGTSSITATGTGTFTVSGVQMNANGTGPDTLNHAIMRSLTSNLTSNLTRIVVQ